MRRTAILSAAALLAACGQSATVSDPAAPRSGRGVVVATFTGLVDHATGQVEIRSQPTEAGRRLGKTVADGTGASVHLSTVGGTYTASGGTCSGGGSATEASIRVSVDLGFASTLQNLYAELTAISDGTRVSCNSDLDTIGVTALNGGLWRYGKIDAGSNAALTWRFPYTGTTSFTFTGQVVAQVSDRVLPGFALSGEQGAVAGYTGTQVVVGNQTAGKVAFVNCTTGAVAAQTVALSGSPNSVATNGTDIWATVAGADELYKISAAGAVLQHKTLAASSFPGSIGVDAAGNAFWLNADETVGKATSGGTLSTCQTLTGKVPLGLVVGPDGKVWFTEGNAGAIGRVTTACASYAEFDGVAQGFPFTVPTAIAVGPGDGSLWFTAAAGLYRMDTAGVVTHAIEDPALGGMTAIATSTDGFLWVANNLATPSRIIRVVGDTLSPYFGDFAYFEVPASFTAYALARGCGPGGATSMIWAGGGTQGLLRIDPQ